MEQLYFFGALFLVLFLPGIAVVRFVERRGACCSVLERAVLALGSSIVVVDLLMLCFDLVALPLRAVFVLPAILVVSALIEGARWYTQPIQTNPLPEQRMSVLFLMTCVLLLVVKTLYFFPNVLPNTTDLGHHLYWVKKMVLDEKIPTYEKRDIITDASGAYAVSAPQPISDFVVGEHLTLAAVQMISGADFDSAFSSLMLLVVHIFSILTLAVLARRLFESHPRADLIASLTLLFVGVFAGLGVPQVKYVLGGVVGNTYGNLFIPLIFLALLLALRSKRAAYLVLALMFIFGLAYTHHLSMFLLALMLITALTLRAFLSWPTLVGEVGPLVRERVVWVALTLALVFFFLWTPGYIHNAAVSTVLGAPEKTEHLGYTLGQLLTAVGEPRFVLGMSGLVFMGLLFVRRMFRDANTVALLSAWILPLVALVMYPDVLKIDLPSGRVANYLIAPLCMLAAFLVVVLWKYFQEKALLPRFLSQGALILFFAGLFFYGYADNDALFKVAVLQREKTVALRHAADFFATRIPPDGTVIHDHVNIPGDSWIKLEFMRDYNYPFYRAYPFRYERASDRTETCTLQIISAPHSEQGRRCLRDLHVRAVFVNEAIDGAQFEHFEDFEKVYADPFYALYAYDPKL